MNLKKYGLWLLFFAFAAVAMLFHEGEPLFVSQDVYPLGKTIVWLMFFGFLVYSIYCSSKEHIFKTIRTIFPLHWTRSLSWTRNFLVHHLSKRRVNNSNAVMGGASYFLCKLSDTALFRNEL